MIYLVSIPTWLILQAAGMNFDLEFMWENSPNAFLNSPFLFVSSAILLIIGIVLLKKYFKNKKDSALLLACYNIIYGFSSFLEGVGNFYAYGSRYDQVSENLIFILVAWAVVFFFLFLQEIFTGSFAYKDHKLTHKIFLSLLVAGVILTMMVLPSRDLDIIHQLGVGILAITLIILSIWQMKAAFHLVKRADEPNVKRGLQMIGISGLCLIAVIVLIVLKMLVEFVDPLIPIFVFSASIFSYLGYVQPSKAKK